MRDWLAALTATLCAGGCSFIYNPNNIDKTNDSGTHVIDAEKIVDVNPSALALASVYPTVVYEGVGQGSSRPALVVVRGSDISKNAIVTVTPATGAATQITVIDTKIALDHTFIAISLAVPIDMVQDQAAGTLALNITVDNGGGVTRTLEGASAGGLKVQFLDQLKTAITAPPAEGKRYSSINISAPNPFPASTTATLIHLRSESAIIFGADITANASATMPGPGGCSGAASGSALTTNAAGYPCGGGFGNTNSGGGGGGHAMAGANGTVAGLGMTAAAGGGAQGSPAILELDMEASGGGGAGATTIGSTGPGGGGGGTIYLDAAGDLTVNSVAANGVAGSSGGANGGGGSGGTVLLKSGGTLSVTTATATPGAATGTGGGAGGAGGTGRVRYDAPMGAPTSSTPTAYQGATFKQVDFVTYAQIVTGSVIQVIGPIGVTEFVGQVYQPMDVAGEAFTLSFGGSGLAQPKVTLTAGYNKICVAVPGGNILVHPESGNCAEIAFLPGGVPE